MVREGTWNGEVGMVRRGGDGKAMGGMVRRGEGW